MNLPLLLSPVVAYIATLIYMLVVQRPLFIIYNRRSVEHISIGELWQVYRHGILSDFIVAAYLTALPLIYLWIDYNIPGGLPMWPLGIIVGMLSLAYSAIAVSDTALYNFWHFKIDASVLEFLKSPKGAFASVSAWYLLAAALTILLFCGGYLVAVMLPLAAVTVHAGVTTLSGYIAGNIIFLLMVAALAVIIRGLRIRPNNPTIVYFSAIPFLNHAALNAIFSFVYTLGKHDPYNGKFQYNPDTDEVNREVAQLYPATSAPTVEFLGNKRPGILFIIWESLSARFVEWTGGTPEVTPCINSLKGESVIFSNARCGSFLTDRGIACLMSGLPGQPTASIVQHTKKLPGLPALPRKLREVGYSTTVIHGGDLSVRQKADYYLAAANERLIAEKDLDITSPRCKWGVHDGVVVERVYKEIVKADKAGNPWMITWQTLSSHEPFDVPMESIEGKMDNAFHYTDSAVASLVHRLKKSGIWDNMIIVISGDHGVYYGSEYGTPLSRIPYTHIPMLITGGAVARPMEISRLVSQADLAATLLGQMGIAHDEFIYSRDVLAPEYTLPFTFHSFHHGVVVSDDSGDTAIDTDTDRVIEGSPDDNRQHRARAVLQHLYSYLAKL